MLELKSLTCNAPVSKSGDMVSIVQSDLLDEVFAFTTVAVSSYSNGCNP